MNVIFNGQLISDSGVKVTIDNRAFQYGDGLFETLIAENGKILYLNDHLERLQKGMAVLKMKFPSPLLPSGVEDQIAALLSAENLNNAARIKLMVWRKFGGLFSPTEKDAEYLITAKEHKPYQPSGRKVDFCNTVRNSQSVISPFKRISSIQYVLAGIEMKEKSLDDIIILDSEGNISECLYSNIFWVKNNIYYTPSLETGCIEGVRRKNALKKLTELGTEIKVVKQKPEELLSADYIFSTNVAGIYPITQLGNQSFPFFIPDL